MQIVYIRQLATHGDMSLNALRYLLGCHGECEHLDYKIELDLDSDHSCASLAKDALAIKNVGGGYIVVGVEDKTWRPIGLNSQLRFDTKMLRDKIRKVSGADIDIDVVHHDILLDGEKASKKFALILIRSSVKRSKLKVPALVRINFKHNEAWGVRQGDIYVRRGDSTVRVSSEDELRDLMDSLEARWDEEEVKQANEVPSPFAVEVGLYRLLSREYLTFIGREKYKIQLHKAIESDPRIWIVNLFGPGGVGKSALATWLAYEYYKERKIFEAILHLSAKDLELSSSDGLKCLRPSLFSLEDFLNKVICLFEYGEYQKAELDEKKKLVVEIFSAFRVLLVLDNMESVNDGRIMEFIRNLPPTNKAKVLLTSRKRTSEWEYPIQVTEFDIEEVKEFINFRNKELNGSMPTNDMNVIRKIHKISGGLPLAIQWILGEYSKTKKLDTILNRAIEPSSPLLEFSFRNSWNTLDDDGKQSLAILSIFENSVTLQEWRTALDWPVEKIERAVSSLVEATFVAERTVQDSGKIVYSALPITLTFARNELAKMGDIEEKARSRYQGYRNRIDLAVKETERYSAIFDQFDAKTDSQKRAIMLCLMADGEIKSLSYQSANQYYKEALEMEPRSVYAMVSCALFKKELGNTGEAIELIKKATQYCTKKTGYYVYYNLSRIYDQSKDRFNKIKSLEKALTYEPHRTIAKHSLGVALSQNCDYHRALSIFDEIIQKELARDGGPSESLVYAYKTKIITLRNARMESDANDVFNHAMAELQRHDHLRHLTSKLDA